MSSSRSTLDPIPRARAELGRPLSKQEDRVPVLMALRLGRSVQAGQLASENADALRGITKRAPATGVIAHRFYGGDG